MEVPVSIILLLSTVKIQIVVFLSISLLILIVASALISASENAFFSLGINDIEDINKLKSSKSIKLLNLLKNPPKLLASILLVNNLVNVSFVILSGILIDNLVDDTSNSTLLFLLNMVVVTVILLLFGEVLPKTYATAKNKQVSLLMASSLTGINKVLSPLTKPLLKSTQFLNKKLKSKNNIFTTNELRQAIEIVTDPNSSSQEKEILKGLVNIGNTTVEEIMKPRTDVCALDINTSFDQVLKLIKKWEYSRMPVYEEDFDTIKGIIYIKDIVPFIQEGAKFDWNKLIRKAIFVPEKMKLDDLLELFREKRMHMGIVVDEFGGSEGIVTMEDLLEEIFGEIMDEFDDEGLSYSRIDSNTILAEGKLSINDFCRIMNLDPEYFDDLREENETLAGLLISIKNRIPDKASIIKTLGFEFIIEDADKRKISRIKATKLNEK